MMGKTVDVPEDRRVDFNPTVRINNGTEHLRALSRKPRRNCDGRPLLRFERVSDYHLTLTNDRQFARFKPRLDAWILKWNPSMVPA